MDRFSQRCSQRFSSHFLQMVLLLLLHCHIAWADGEGDNDPTKVRRVPRLGIVVSDADETALKTGLSELKSLLDKLSQSAHEKKLLIPDIEVYYRAVKDNLEHQEFFTQKDVKKAFELLETGKQRAIGLLTPWQMQTGLVVRGFRSKLDGTVQPYGLVIPENYRHGGEKEFRLDVWFHGRGETLSETNFIDQRTKNAGYYQPKDTIVLHPYGRYSNAFKFAGEVDVLEAIEHVRSQYRIDNDRVSVRGFSMGGAACWQFATLYSDRWFAANPGAGFSETPEFLKSFQKEKLKPYDWEEKLWRWYDADDNALNLFHAPTIAYSGENDIQKQAADVMEKALAKEGISLVHVIGPKMGHRIDAASQKIIESRMGSLAKAGNEVFPTTVRKLTHTLKYNRQYWLTVDSLEQHWEPSRVEAKVKENVVSVKSGGVTAMTFEMNPGFAPFDLTRPVTVRIDGQQIQAPHALSDRSWKYSVHRSGDRWVPGQKENNGLVKKHGLQGPIDDALMSSFLMVLPTGAAINEAVGKWTKSEQLRAIAQWRQHFRGHARIKNDIDITATDIAKHNLILWGDPKSNAIIKKILNELPLAWTAGSVKVGSKSFSAKDHAPIMIYPNPLNPEKYIVINSGFTYREYAYLNNARQVPMLPDWAIVDILSKPEPNESIYRFAGIPKAADFFDENWSVKE